MKVEPYVVHDDKAPAAGHSTAVRGSTAVLKRLMDVIGGTIAIVCFAPLMILTAVLIKLTSSGPILFVQERVGEQGKVFRIFKFRTMLTNAEDLLDELVDIDALEEPVFKLKDDPRVTRIGRHLRRWSIDELPQLVNVLRGEMSLVGPRPEEARIVRYYNSWHRMRLLAKPGITGPVQVNGRGDLPLAERVRLEVEYIEHYTLWTDIQILLKTIPVVLRGNGCY